MVPQRIPTKQDRTFMHLYVFAITSFGQKGAGLEHCKCWKHWLCHKSVFSAKSMREVTENQLMGFWPIHMFNIRIALEGDMKPLDVFALHWSTNQCLFKGYQHHQEAHSLTYLIHQRLEGRKLSSSLPRTGWVSAPSLQRPHGTPGTDYRSVRLSLEILMSVIGQKLKGNQWRYAHLPPVGILSVDDLKNVAFLEGHPGLSARDQVVIGRVVIKVRAHVHLWRTQAQWTQMTRKVERLKLGTR